LAKTKATNASRHKRAQGALTSGGPRTGSPQKGPVRNGPTIRKKSRRSLYLVLGILAVLTVIIVGFVFLQRWQTIQTSQTPGYGQAEPVDATVLQEVTGVSPSTWEAIGTGGVTQPFTPISGAAPLKGSNGLPEVLYVGGEYCPNCAAERWAMLSALSRFGTFKNVSQIHSYEGSIATFSFEGSSYTSPYVDFVPREISGNTVDSSGNYVTLDQLTSDQQQIFAQEDSAGSIPFMDIGNSYKLIGASYQYTTLEDGSGNPLSWQDIASSLGNTSSPIAQNILGTANDLTAAICRVDGQVPASVCQVSAIQQLEQALGPTASTAPGSPLTDASASTAAGEQPRRMEKISAA
jgi:hypothetical protein